jgi:hypothetical protein
VQRTIPSRVIAGTTSQFGSRKHSDLLDAPGGIHSLLCITQSWDFSGMGRHNPRVGDLFLTILNYFLNPESLRMVKVLRIAW